MGVTGLWQILQPCARPIKIETLNRKRLAVDASIWIYQFLKAVRDKEGNALRNSHVVGFFRRICKLLFFGIKPVFVFDGGAPVLKRNTITNRKKRREGRREDAARTAGRLLAVQMQRKAEEEEKNRRETEKNRADGWEEDVPDDQLVYVDELQMSAQERQQNRKFRKKDQYHLPDLDVSMADMGGPNDPRIMSLEELEAYARQFDTGEDINVYDFSKIDYDSPFFTSLPASDRYNILNAARLRSRLRMGHSKEQLDTMFPDRMAFSKFQIERVAERNELTQRLMNINDPNGEMEFGINGTGRVAGEKGREYVLVKNDGVEGGWALGVVSNEGQQERPIDVDKPVTVMKEEDESDEDDGFEDVPIEGLNRLPKIPADMHGRQRASAPSRKHRSRRTGRRRGPRPPKAPAAADPDSLFIAQAEPEDFAEESDVASEEDLFGEADEQDGDDEAELQRAIAMSLETDQANEQDGGEQGKQEEEEFEQIRAPELEPIRGGSYREIAAGWNKRARATAPKSREITSFGVPVLRDDGSEDDDDATDLQAALAMSREAPAQPKNAKPMVPDVAAAMAKKAGFSGPLPFESLNLGSSLLGKKKMQERTEEAAGGFIDPAVEPKQQEKKSDPLPPWFSGDPDEDLQKQKQIDAEREEKEAQFRKQFQFDNRNERKSVLRRADTSEVIDLEAEDYGRGFKPGEVVNLDDDEDLPEATQQESELATPSDAAEQEVASPVVATAPNTAPIEIRAEPFDDAPNVAPVKNVPFLMEDDEDDEGALDWSESEDERPPKKASESTSPPHRSPGVELQAVHARQTSEQEIPNQSGEEPQVNGQPETQPATRQEPSAPRSPSVEFEDVDMTEPTLQLPEPEPIQAVEEDTAENFDLVATMAMDADSPAGGEGEQPVDPDDVDYFSDIEEEELIKALNLEAEEHARFASSLNNKSQAQNIADYEKELKQLRNQQKKDRRDADEVTQVMVQECQQLLRLFGLPYVTAPMEAEAQCAELVQLGLVDGIVTDDSDCFLFGGTRVYKNMFNQAKFVECYLTSDMEKEFQLTRNKLISIAQLLGSDYTEGLTGVGPVTALEIISEFPTLEDFKAWLEGVQLQQITKEDDKGNPFRRKFRKTATKLMLPIAFPDRRVEMAYLEPDVDKDPEPFQWGVPDLDSLRNFLMATIGWTQERADEILVPVIKDMNKRLDEGTQANITGFFSGTVGTGTTAEAFAPRKRAAGSKRLGNAMEKLAARAQRTRSRGGVGDGSEEGDSSAATPEQEDVGREEGDGSASEATTGRKRRKAPAKKQTRKKAKKTSKQ